MKTAGNKIAYLNIKIELFFISLHSISNYEDYIMNYTQGNTYDNALDITQDITHDINEEITWDDLATPIAQPVLPVIDTNGWHWYPDSNGQLFTTYFDVYRNECMMWGLQDNGSFYWRCANVGYTCREIGIEGRRGIFFQDLLVGTMLLDQDLTVTWLPETYIYNYDNAQNINDFNIEYNYNDYNDINITDESEEDDTNDE
jgi:hypothetical protein